MLEFLFFILGLTIGATFFWWLANQKLRSKYEGKTENLQNRLMQEKQQTIQAKAELEAHKNQSAENEKYLKESFENIASRTMKNNNETFIQLARETMEKYLIKANDDNENKERAIEQLIKPLKESLNKHEQMVKQMESNSNRTFGSLKTYLEELTKSQKSLEKETGALVNALKSPKVRGRWGEIGLKRIVEFSGMSAYCDFEEQVNVNTDEGRMRPDMLVHLPDNKKIVVDSKVPLSAFLESLESEDENKKQELAIRHSRALLQHVKDLSSKAYWSQFDNSVDFVVLYIEVESALGLALMNNKNLIVEGLKNRIVFATPTTLITLLQTVAFSWKQHQATENAIKIWESAKELHERIAVFIEHFGRMGGNISSLVKAFNSAVGSWEGRVLPGLKKMEELGVNPDKKQIETLNEIESATRELKK